MATLLSVNVGLPQDVSWSDRVVHTGIWKAPVDGPVMARRLNLDGDGQGDLAGHGGEQRAVMVYQAESYDYWQRYLHRSDLSWGIFGENFTVDGLADDQVCIGDQYRIGEAQFEVTQPRTTCYRVGVRLDEPRMAALLVAEHRPGFYLRVLREGHVRSGDEIVQIGAAAERVSVASSDALLYLPDGDVSTMRRLLKVRALSPGWRGSFDDLVNQADHPAPERANRPAPAWEGFRRMHVARLTRETDLVTSVYLCPVEMETLPPALPGQYLTVRLAGSGIPVAVRSYSLSESAPDHYRISVKRETQGIASGYIANALAVGDAVDVAAPRGEFILGDGHEPVLLVSAGIGITPVLAMLQALVAGGSSRLVWWLHTTKTPATDALAAEVGRLIDSLPAGHSKVFYTACATTDSPAGSRLDAAALAALDVPTDASAYVCGPIGFMDAVTTALVDLGIERSRVHTERFSSLSAINPGVVATDLPAPHPPRSVGTGPMVTFARAGITAAYNSDNANLLEMAESCDIPTRWSCRTGVCHTCSTPMLAGTVAYRPLPLTDPAAGEVLLCCSTPESDVVLDL